ncbi:MAG: GerAB/ArcD/ProY family transporter [Oscillospiraceae bacterium]|jgi:spore germination protein KB|nr:GerAB/ArcD/ProY family transporter [Oscillospiraceae bacterium]
MENTASANATSSSEKYSISAYQYFSVILFSGLFGINLYPTLLTAEINRNWLAAQILSILCAVASIALVLFLFKKTGAKSFRDLCRMVLGEKAGSVLLWLIGIHLISSSVVIPTIQIESITAYVMRLTPLVVIMGLFVLCAVVMVQKGRFQISKTAEIFCPIVIMISLVLLIIMTSSINPLELRVLMQPDEDGFFLQFINSFSSFSSIELIFFFMGDLKFKEKREKTTFIAVALLSVLLLTMFICETGIYTIDGISHIASPTIEMLRIVNIKNVSFFEHGSTFLAGVKIVNNTLFLSIMMYCIYSCFSKKDYSKTFPKSSWLYGAFVVAGMLFVYKFNLMKPLKQMIVYSQMGILFVVVPLLLIIFIIRGFSKKGKEAKTNAQTN